MKKNFKGEVNFFVDIIWYGLIGGYLDGFYLF